MLQQLMRQAPLRGAAQGRGPSPSGLEGFRCLRGRGGSPLADVRSTALLPGDPRAPGTAPPPGESLQSKRTATCKQVSAASALHGICQPVEQGFPYAVRGGS